MAYELATTVPG